MTYSKPDWDFVESHGVRDDGIHNPMIEHFTGNYNYHLAREIIQNSLDAKKESISDPVQVDFKLVEIKQQEFPGYDTLLKTFGFCLESWKEDGDAESFFKKALSIIKKDKIQFLKVSDYNTKGLSGSDDQKKGGWHSLVKSQGSSSKTGGEGGSYGIGKGATFASSDLRVVFYSTFNESSNSIFQGIAELVSFNEDGVTKRGIGAFGINQASIRRPEQLAHFDKFWRRKETGTDIFIAGYKATKDWKDELIKSVLRNFWYAISQNELRVKIEEEDISNVTIEHYLVHYFQKELFKDHLKPIGNPLQYYKAIKEGKLFPKSDLKILKAASFYFIQTPEHMNYVALMRKSHMVIYSKRFNFQGNFAGVFICDDKEGNQILRLMEPPAHDIWDTERHPKGELVLDEINNFVRECLDTMREKQTGSILEIPELNKILPYDEEGDNSGKNKGGNEYTGEKGKEETSQRIPEKMIFEKRSIINPYKVSVFNSPVDGVDGEEEGKKNKEGIRKKRKGTKEGEGSKKGFTKQQINVRSFIVSEDKEKILYKTILRPNFSGKVNLKINAVGEIDNKDKVEIYKASYFNGDKLQTSGNRIYSVDLENNKLITIQFEIKSPIKYSLKIEQYAV